MTITSDGHHTVAVQYLMLVMFRLQQNISLHSCMLSASAGKIFCNNALRVKVPILTPSVFCAAKWLVHCSAAISENQKVVHMDAMSS